MTRICEQGWTFNIMCWTIFLLVTSPETFLSFKSLKSEVCIKLFFLGCQEMDSWHKIFCITWSMQKRTCTCPYPPPPFQHRLDLLMNVQWHGYYWYHTKCYLQLNAGCPSPGSFLPSLPTVYVNSWAISKDSLSAQKIIQYIIHVYYRK